MYLELIGGTVRYLSFEFYHPHVQEKQEISEIMIWWHFFYFPSFSYFQ